MAGTREKARYHDLGRLGTGGMATVTLAEDLVLRRRVALKRVHAAGDPRELSRLRREALVGASLNHHNLVAVYDVQEAEDGDLVIVMEYVEGETLREAIRRRGAFPADQALSVMRGLADALDALHDRRIVHRDVKPENILLGTEAVKLADLGIARTAEQTQTTAGGALAGTFSYMAPEQLEGGEPSPAIDVYALAAVAFEMLSGKKARRESNPVALAHAIARQPPPDLREQWPQAPAEAVDVLKRAMSRDPVARPRSAGVLVDQLGKALAAQTQRTRPVPPPPRRPRRPAPPMLEAGRGAQRAFLAPARRRSSPRAVRIGACLALLLALGLIAALIGSTGSSGPRRVRSTLATKGAAGRPASERGSSAHGSSTGSATSASRQSGDGEEAASSTGSSRTTSAGKGAGPAQAANPPSTAAVPVSGVGSPSAAVQSFYGDAARHDYAAAWQLADANMRAQLAGFESFRAQQSAVRSITFHRAQVISGAEGPAATVAVRTTAVLAGRTEQCSGTVRLLKNPQGPWLLDGISINCVP